MDFALLAVPGLTGLHVAVGACVLLLMGVLLCSGLRKKEKLQREFLEVQLDQRQRELADCRERAVQLDALSGRLATENRDLALEVARLQAVLTASREQQEQMAAARQQLEQEFHILADRIFTEKGRLLAEQQREGLQQMLLPMREQLRDFKNRVESLHEIDSRDRVSLGSELHRLQELNQQLSRDAVNLAGALKGENKLQGNWGEMILEKLLEDSGLRPGQEFRVQAGFLDSSGARLRPDVVVCLPQNRTLVIDAKVSLQAYERAARAVDESAAKEHLQQHLASVRRHIKNLSGKRYHEIRELATVDFVLLFMPVEGAFQAAVSGDAELLSWAMRQRVILCSPSSLLAILRTIQHLWRVDEQSKNAFAIAKQAGKLYDTIAAFIETFEDVGCRLELAGQSWQRARRQLLSGPGNLVRRTRKLRDLGVQSEKQLSEALELDDESSLSSAFLADDVDNN